MVMDVILPIVFIPWGIEINSPSTVQSNACYSVMIDCKNSWKFSYVVHI
jgi:hypothetical protein